MPIWRDSLSSMKPGGPVSQDIAAMTEGDQLDWMGPLGTGFHPPQRKDGLSWWQEALVLAPSTT